MKKLLTASMFVAMLTLLVAPRHSFAQSGTLVVYASGNSLDQVIGADTTTGGLQKHSVYRLVSTDTTYLLDATITIKSSASIVGVSGANGKLPCIQADLVGTAITGVFFSLNGAGTRVNFENLYFLGVAPNNANNTSAGQGISVDADNISLTLNNCVLDNLSQFAVRYESNGDNFYITNCIFRNGIDVASAYYVPELLRSNNGAGNWDTDSVVVTNNTLIGVAMGIVETTGLTNYMNFSHNTVVLTSKGPFWSEHEVNLVFDYNIFYDTYATGETPAEYFGGWDEIKPPRIPAVFYLAPLDSTTAAKLLGHARATAKDSADAEAARKIEVVGNDCYWSSGLTNFWTSYNDTTTGGHMLKDVNGKDSLWMPPADSIYTPVFMNSQTMAMFNSSTSYPHLVQNGNISTDPGFGWGIQNAVTNATPDSANGVGLAAFVQAVRGGKGTTQWYAYQRVEVPQPQPDNWVPTWPLPEMAALHASNLGLAPDGQVYGDTVYANLTAVQQTNSNVPSKFNISNNYPNPFNPTTVVQVSLHQSGMTSLKVYNVLGQLVKVVVEGFKPAGEYKYDINMDNFASGVYFYTLRQGTNSITKKMLLLK